MIARAPGKIVISGAYAVLEGAPALVMAVDRYAIADGSRSPELITPEMRPALGAEVPPWVDGSALRARGQKLGLGSSSAILVAALGARELRRHGYLGDQRLKELVFRPALRAHAQAQGGGSGIDVAASVHGGTLVARRQGDDLLLDRARLPSGLHLAVWSCGRSGSTPELLHRVRLLRRARPAVYARWIQGLGAASVAALDACDRNSTADFLRALSHQWTGLASLGRAADAPIVTREVNALGEYARDEEGVVLPSGAGHGDVALFAGLRPPTPRLLALARELGHEPLELGLSARGVHAANCSDSGRLRKDDLGSAAGG
jgi:phosphomevalonate kinase